MTTSSGWFFSNHSFISELDLKYSSSSSLVAFIHTGLLASLVDFKICRLIISSSELSKIWTSFVAIKGIFNDRAILTILG